MIMECQKCGAPLDVPPGTTMARCAYCEATVHLRSPKQAPSNSHFVPSQVPQRPGKTSKTWIVLAAAGSSSLVLGGVLLMLLMPRVASQSSPGVLAQVARAVLPADTGPAHWGASPSACAVDANGDGVFDLAGMAGSLGAPDRPTVIDGASGKVLWSAASTPNQTQLACLGTEWIVVVEPNFQAAFYDVRNLGAPVRVLLRDTLSELGLGPGCARLRTADGSTQGIELPGGNAVSCEAKLRRYHGEQPGIIGLTDESTELGAGKRAYRLSKRRRGTEILTLRVSEGDALVWSKELPYAAPTFDTGLAVGADTIVLWAAEPANQQKGILVGIDEATGNQLYAKPSDAQVSNSLGYFGFNGRYVITQVWTSLEAYDPRTGERVWKVGR